MAPLLRRSEWRLHVGILPPGQSPPVWSCSRKVRLLAPLARTRVESAYLVVARTGSPLAGPLVSGWVRVCPGVTDMQLAQPATYSGDRVLPSGQLNASGAVDPTQSVLEA